MFIYFYLLNNAIIKIENLPITPIIFSIINIKYNPVFKFIGHFSIIRVKLNEALNYFTYSSWLNNNEAKNSRKLVQK